MFTCDKLQVERLVWCLCVIRKDTKPTFEGYGVFAKAELGVKCTLGFKKNTEMNKHERTLEQRSVYVGRLGGKKRK